MGGPSTLHAHVADQLCTAHTHAATYPTQRTGLALQHRAAEQLFTALKWMGREVLFVRFEEQSHGLSRGGHPKMRLERLRHIKAWFEKYLK